MRASHHNICCTSLTHSMFKELVLESEGRDFNLFLVSPAGNIFLLGDIDDVEEIEIDEHHTEYTMIDAGDTHRRVLFHDELSDYSILLNADGAPYSSTGIAIRDDEDDEWKNFVKYETGQIGQECTANHEVEDPDE